MPSLNQILDATRATLPALAARRDELEAAVASSPIAPDFRARLRGSQVGVIAEVKRRSPSAGAINEGLDPVELARAYSRGGAVAISVLTDAPFFGGSMEDLRRVAAAVPLPALRKDFIVDRLQLLEARVAGASAALLIVRVLSQIELRQLIADCSDLQLTPLVEVHTRDELARAIDVGAAVIGVNARDLDTFVVDTNRACDLIRQVPAELIAIAESGLTDTAKVEAAGEAGADAVLVGSALAASDDPETAVRAFATVARRAR